MNYTLKELKKELKEIQEKKFEIKHEYQYCKCCGARFSEEVSKSIIKGKKEDFECFKESSIAYINMEIRELRIAKGLIKRGKK